MNVHVLIIAYALTDPLIGLFDSLSGPAVTWHLFLHSPRPAVMQACDQLATRPQVVYHPYGVNRGLALSYNDCFVESFAAGAEAVLILADDMIVAQSALDQLVQGAAAHPDAGIISGHGRDDQLNGLYYMGLTFCLLRPSVLARVGYFDENFRPIYFEDVDYGRRCGLAGVQTLDVGTLDMTHLGRASHRAEPDRREANNARYARNEAYYVRKWGGRPGRETFPVPFNDPGFTFHIAEADRHDPYPAYRPAEGA